MGNNTYNGTSGRRNDNQRGNITRPFDGVSYTIRNNLQSASINGSFTVEAGWANQGCQVSWIF